MWEYYKSDLISWSASSRYSNFYFKSQSYSLFVFRKEQIVVGSSLRITASITGLVPPICPTFTRINAFLSAMTYYRWTTLISSKSSWLITHQPDMKPSLSRDFPPKITARSIPSLSEASLQFCARKPLMISDEVLSIVFKKTLVGETVFCFYFCCFLPSIQG